MDKYLHIVTLDVPYPADYGGAIEQFYKIVNLHRIGIKIHLHCFTKKRPPSAELNRYCETVHYYPRKTGLSGFSLRLPYIVSSRSSASLIENLSKDNYPILLEGVHCTYGLYKNVFSNRTVLVRLHNAEFRYYDQLAKHENGFFRKFYYSWESRILKKYEQRLCTNNKIIFAALSNTDKAVYEKELKARHVHFIPAFVAWEKVNAATGKGCYCLYHGNLSINENDEAAVWLLQNVFDRLPIPFVMAGKAPSERLKHLAHLHGHTCLVADPGEKEMQDMIAKAQVNILPSFNSTGVKLKLLNALFSGRHCLVNSAGVEGSELDSLCETADDAEAFRQKISRLYEIPFSEAEIRKREKMLGELNNNQKNAEKLAQLIWP